jgi:hypothetical protein
MGTELKLKKSSIPGKLPLASDLEYGELAINYADGKLYFKKANNAVDSFISGDTNYVMSIAGLTGAVTSQQLLTAINSVDGPGSGLNADFLDGFSASDFINTAQASATFAGTVSHTGLLLTEGTNVDQIRTFTKSLTLTGNWQDIGITGTNLSNGTYIVQLYANDSTSGGSNIDEYYSGTMSWFFGTTTSDQELPTDEIALHRAGASEDGGLYLRTYRVENGFLKLQIYSNRSNTSPANYVFKFRRML